MAVMCAPSLACLVMPTHRSPFGPMLTLYLKQRAELPSGWALFWPKMRTKQRPKQPEFKPVVVRLVVKRLRTGPSAVILGAQRLSILNAFVLAPPARLERATPGLGIQHPSCSEAVSDDLTRKNRKIPTGDMS